MVCRQGDSNAECSVIPFLFCLFLHFTARALSHSLNQCCGQQLRSTSPGKGTGRIQKLRSLDCPRLLTDLPQNPAHERARRKSGETRTIFYFILFFRKIGKHDCSYFLLQWSFSLSTHGAHNALSFRKAHAAHTIYWIFTKEGHSSYLERDNFADYIRHTWAS